MTQQFVRVGCALALLAACGIAQAQVAGTLSVRAGFTRIMPQTQGGDLTAPSFPHTHVDGGADTALTGGLNYMVTDHWALDLPVGLPFKHSFYGDGAIAGVGKLGQTQVVPATLFAQYLLAKPAPRCGLTWTWA